VLVRLVEEELVHILLVVVVAVVEERHIHLAVEGNRLERVVVDILLPVDQGRLGTVAVQDMNRQDVAAVVLGADNPLRPVEHPVEELHNHPEHLLD
jgi:hypothetical protein